MSSYGLTPIPACDIWTLELYTMSSPLNNTLHLHVGYMQRDLTKSMRGAPRRERIFPLEMALMSPSRMEIPQAKYQVTYMMFPSATWESKAKRYTRKGGTFTIYEKCMVMPYTGDPRVGGIPESWKVIMTNLFHLNTFLTGYE